MLPLLILERVVEMSIDWIRKMYGVPAKVGGRIEYTGGKTPCLGTITDARGGHLRIKLDEAK